LELGSEAVLVAPVDGLIPGPRPVYERTVPHYRCAVYQTNSVSSSGLRIDSFMV